jgi:hypothetical protein
MTTMPCALTAEARPLPSRRGAVAAALLLAVAGGALPALAAAAPTAGRPIAVVAWDARSGTTLARVAASGGRLVSTVGDHLLVLAPGDAGLVRRLRAGGFWLAFDATPVQGCGDPVSTTTDPTGMPT